MKKVDIVRPSSINAINGPIGTLKRIIKNKDYFNDRGYDITLFANESIQKGPFKIIPESSLSGMSKSINPIRQKVSTWLRKRARTDLWAAKLIDKKIRNSYKRLVDYYISLNRNPDIVQFHSDFECYYFLKNYKGKIPKIVLFQHSDGIPFKMLLEALPGLNGSKYLEKIKKEYNWTMENVDRLVFIAKIGQTNFLQYFPQIKESDTSVIINGIDKLDDCQTATILSIKEKSQEPKYRLCCTGTISFRKGQRIVIEAVGKLNEELRNQVRIDFIGDGAERHSLEQLAKDLGIERQVSFLGNIPNQDVYKCLAENNIYILMSYNEGLPISIIEAMRIGLPIISTKVSGIPELVEEGVNGFLLNPDVDELTSLLQKLPDYDWDDMGRNSKTRFDNEFTFERMEKEFCDMYDMTLNLE